MKVISFFKTVFLIGGVLLLFTGLAMVLQVKSSAEYYTGPDCEVELVEARNTGNAYGEWEARAGYDFWELTFQVQNNSSIAGEMDELEIHIYGETSGDVRQMQEWEGNGTERKLFSGAMEDRLPGGRSCEIQRAVQVKKGVKEILAEYQYDRGEAQELVISLE